VYWCCRRYEKRHQRGREERGEEERDREKKKKGKKETLRKKNEKGEEMAISSLCSSLYLTYPLS
jgi:hypothetical protein